MGFSGWSPEAVQFFKGLQADNTKACWGARKAFYETSVPSSWRRCSMS
jgi:hypothetical protein